MAANHAPQSSITTLRILNLLLRHFAHGLTNAEIAKAVGISAPLAYRHVAALEAEGMAERIPETSRIRPSIRLAQAAMSIAKSLDDAQRRMAEIASRIHTGN